MPGMLIGNTNDMTTFAWAGSLAQSPLLKLWDGTWPYIVMMLGFSVIVFVHELGHFLLAKWAGVRVDRFAIGFGRELLGFTKGETRYSFNILPLGGYVKMLGQEDFDDKAEELKFKDDPTSFVNKPVGHRMAIVSAGVVMNILFACALFMIVFHVGKEDLAPRVAIVEPDSPAAESGILPGDVIVEMNGRRVLTFNDVTINVFLAPPHEPIEFVVERNGERLDPIHVTPEQKRPEGSRGGSRLMVGIGPGRTAEIAAVALHLDAKNPANPRPGDKIVEVDGLQVTDENVDQLLSLLAYTKGDVIVERRAGNPRDRKEAAKDAATVRMEIDVPPNLTLIASDPSDGDTRALLGFRPLMRFLYVEHGSRADLAGLSEGDTILAWDDIPYPNLGAIDASVREQPGRDIPFNVQTSTGAMKSGFVRPKVDGGGYGSIAARISPMAAEVTVGGGPKAIVASVRPRGPADQAGLKQGDRILACNGVDNPTSSAVNKAIRSRDESFFRKLSTGHSRMPIHFKVKGADGGTRTCVVNPQAPGQIGASYVLIAEDVLVLGPPAPDKTGSRTIAAAASVPPGSKILAIGDTEVSTWTGMVRAFRQLAGNEVPLRFQDRAGTEHVLPFYVPHSLRTLLEVGPEARIVSIDDKTMTEVETKRGKSQVSVNYHYGTRKLLEQLVGRKDVTVKYRPHPLAPIETKQIDVTEDMVDPWLARVSLRPNVDLADEVTLIKGESAFDAVQIGFHQTYYVMLQVYQTIKRMVYSRSVGVENISGPLGIIHIGGRVARMGISEFLFFMALISANLAVINFLPLPIVDGGLMVFLIIEKIKGSPVSLRVQVATQMIGLALIISCFIFVTYNDALKLWG